MRPVSQDYADAGGKRNYLFALVGPLLLALAVAPSSTESAIANGDTRTITLSSSHTNESGSFTYMVNGYYDPAVLEKLNWFCRDWRLNEPTKMDPKLFDIIWQVYRDSGSRQPVDVLSAYRSPQTNAMLRRRSRQVAEHSQHMEGRAIDAHFLDVGTATVRDITMRMQAGGVGFYPIGSTPWIHMDSGSVRYWPRMSRDALTRLFPDGKTVFIPSDGQPMPGYEQARAEIEARGGAIQTASPGGGFGFLSFLFGGARGGGADDDEESGPNSVVISQVRSGRGGMQTASAVVSDAPTVSRSNSSRGQSNAPVATVASAPDALNGAKSNLPRGQTYAQAPPDSPPVPESAPAPPASDTQVAAAVDADPPADADAVSLRGPVATKLIAPLPPRKPANLADVDETVGAPLPPARPTEFVVASQESKPSALPSSQANGDLIAALLERGKLPRAITHGVGTTPSTALALAADPSATRTPPERPALLARAAALTAPLPPARPTLRPPVKPAGREADGGTSVAPTRTSASASTATSAERSRKEAPGHGASLTNPYGELILDAFNVQPPAPSADAPSSVDGLRGSSK